MVQPAIVAVATATPPHRYRQSELLAYIERRGLYRSPAVRRHLPGFFGEAIAERALAIPDLERFTPDETPGARNRRYREWAVRLGTEAAARCLAQAGLGVDAVDCVVTTSCTGYTCPGLDTRILEQLGFRGGQIERANLLGMGCASALSALQRAYDFVVAHPGGRALVVAVEVCSATYVIDEEDLGTVVANALFADGAAAALVADDPRGIALRAFASDVRPEHRGVMGYDNENPQGLLRVYLAREVPQLAGEMIRGVVERLLERAGLGRGEIAAWLLHAGGRRVIDVAQEGLGLSDEQVALSREVLRRNGNLSSATVLFVLEAAVTRRPPPPGGHGLLLAVGPGFCAEGAWLTWPS
ncbi:MAG TPA: type III polyketide synthase [Thermodesulfobacteriota bacterium]|nr:type III polyketide synthase [Thermodesulfobacteriota bacterium]